MKTKAKGFTLIELIIALAITVLVMGAIYTFFISSNKTLSTTEVRSELQEEAKNIQEILVVIGTEGKGINNVVDGTGNIITNYSEGFASQLEVDNNKKLQLKSIELNCEDDFTRTFIYDDADNTLLYRIKDKDGNVSEEILSRNVDEFSIRPLDIRMVDLDTALFSEATGLEFNINLNKKKGYSDVDYPISVITKFRNK